MKPTRGASRLCFIKVYSGMYELNSLMNYRDSDSREAHGGLANCRTSIITLLLVPLVCFLCGICEIESFVMFFSCNACLKLVKKIVRDK